MPHNHTIHKLLNGTDLTRDEAAGLLGCMMDGVLSEVQIASVLTLIKRKSPTVDELEGYITAMRSRMIRVSAPENAIDTCGTGGDGHHTFNISTVSALVVAACGVPVAKHGNRSATSKCGSADVLEALGVNILLEPNQATRVLSNAGIVFLFAPTYHPALKPIAVVRKQLPFPTVFNFLGPFCNPAGTRHQVIGVPDARMATLLAKVATRLDYTHLAILTGPDGLDEAGLHAPARVITVAGKRVMEETIDPVALGLAAAPISAFTGGDAAQNAAIASAILDGERGPRRDVVLLNAALALNVAGVASDLPAGLTMAKNALESGAARTTLHQLIHHSTLVI
ncbi:MAG: anthranilate phosphoribosyltransferase [Patescibacteria group bacterium]|nr:anthranilate phosphoribosyltransferase [Patescibacteria group bacterium]